MFRAVFCAPILGVKPSYEFVFRSYRNTEIGMPISLTLTPNENEDGRVVYDAEHTVFNGEIEVRQKFLTCDSELYIEGTSFQYFDTELLHSLAFLLTIRARNPLYMPVFCTRSVLTGEVNEWIGDDVQPLVKSAVGAAFPCKKLNRIDKGWIQKNWTNCIRLTKVKRFQDCMQALNSFSSIPYINFSFLTVCTGLEAVFRISGYSKRSKLAVAVANLLNQPMINEEVEEIYGLRNSVAHGNHRESGVTGEISLRTFALLCECLEKVIENRIFPRPFS